MSIEKRDKKRDLPSPSFYILLTLDRHGEGPGVGHGNRVEMERSGIP